VPGGPRGAGPARAAEVFSDGVDSRGPAQALGGDFRAVAIETLLELAAACALQCAAMIGWPLLGDSLVSRLPAGSGGSRRTRSGTSWCFHRRARGRKTRCPRGGSSSPCLRSSSVSAQSQPLFARSRPANRHTGDGARVTPSVQVRKAYLRRALRSHGTGPGRYQPARWDPRQTVLQSTQRCNIW